MLSFTSVGDGNSKNILKCFIIFLIFLVVAAAIIVPFTLLLNADTVCIRPEGELHRLQCPWRRNEKISRYTCEKYGCIWNETSNAPPCYLPQKNGFIIRHVKSDVKHLAVRLEKSSNKSFFDEPYKNVGFFASCISKDLLHVQITGDDAPKVITQSPKDDCSFKEAFYYIDVNATLGAEFNFRILWKNTNDSVWDTRIGGLILEPHFLQIATFLPSKIVYGLGQVAPTSFQRKLDFTSRPLLIQNESPGDEGLNLNGYNPFYLCLENGGRAHGVLFHNLVISDYTLLEAPGLSIRALGGDLSFTVLFGRSVRDVYHLLTNIVGRATLPPSWALGFHLATSRDDLESSEVNIHQEVLLDSIFVDSNLWENREVFNPESFRNESLMFIESAANGHLNWNVMIDPSIHADANYPAFSEGFKNDVYIKNSLEKDDVMFAAGCGNKEAAFPDLMSERSSIWWHSGIKSLQIPFQNQFAGAIVMMHVSCSKTESCEDRRCLSLHCQANDTYDFPAYMPAFGEDREFSTVKTICMSGIHDHKQRHLQIHSSYGMLMSALTHRSCEEVRLARRCLVMSRSTSVTAGLAVDLSMKKHVRSIGSLLGMDGKEEWAAIHKSVIGMLEANLYGIPYVGSDVCGSETPASASVCKAWIQSMALSPFFRMRHAYYLKFRQNVHIMESLWDTLRMRYMFFPYVYSAFYHAAKEGKPVIRPLFYEFEHDEITYHIDNQYLVGEAVMVVAVLKEVNFFKAYFPDDAWYRLNRHVGRLFTYTNGTKEVGEKSLPLIFVRGGYILPWLEKEDPELLISHSNTVSLAVFHKDSKSKGFLFWDDGISVDTVTTGKYLEFSFHHENRELIIRRTHENSISKDLYLSKIYLYGVPRSRTVLVNGVTSEKKPTYDQASQFLTLELDLKLSDLSSDGTWIVQWKN